MVKWVDDSERKSAMTTLRLLISDSYDPWFNLAVEECIFRQMPATQRVLFLWRNADTDRKSVV